MMDALLTNLADEFLAQDITAPSAVVAALYSAELQAAYDYVLDQFAPELLIGAHQDSSWRDGNLGPISSKLPSTLSSSKWGDGRQGVTLHNLHGRATHGTHTP